MSLDYQRLYSMLLEAIPSSVLLVSRDLRVVSANRNFLDKGNRRLADTVGQRIGEVLPHPVVDQTDLMDRLRQTLAGQDDGRPRNFTYRAPGVPLRCYYYRLIPCRTDGPVEAVMLLLDDITEQVRLGEEVRRVERHLACVIDSASDIVLSTDREGRLLTWNRAAEHLAGYPAERVHGRPLSELVTAEDRDTACAALRDVVAGGGPRYGRWSLLGADGEARPFAWVCSPLRDEMSDEIGIVGVGRDLSTQQRMEWRLAQAQRFAALGVMAGGLAHELRNPLAICSSYVQVLLKDDSDPADRRACLEHIYAAVKRAGATIDDLVRYARNPSLSQAFEPIDLSAVLGEVLELLAPQAKFQQISLVPLLPSQPVWVSGSATLLQQLCMSLCLHALDTIPGDGRLTVLLESREGQVAIVLGDTSTPLADGDFVDLFDPLSGIATGQGAGLDLSLCYSIVKQHLGSIRMAKSPSGGTAFTVCLSTM